MEEKTISLKLVYILLILILLMLIVMGVEGKKQSSEDVVEDISNYCSKIEVSLDIGPEEPKYMFKEKKNIMQILNIVKLNEWKEGEIYEEISAIEYLYLHTKEYKYIVGIRVYDSDKTGFDVVKIKGDKVCSAKTYLSGNVSYSCLIDELRLMCNEKKGSFITTNAEEKRDTAAGTVKQVVFTDLDKNSSQEYKGVLRDGREYVVGIEEVSSNVRSTTRTFKVYYNSGIVNCYFYMDVTNNQCTSAYNKKIICVGATYDNVSFTRNTSRAKLSFDISSYLDIVNFNAWLVGTCTGSDNDITVSYNF